MPAGVAIPPALAPYMTARLAAAAMLPAPPATERVIDSAIGVIVTMTARSLSTDITADTIRIAKIRPPPERATPGRHSAARAMRRARPCLRKACPKSMTPIR